MSNLLPNYLAPFRKLQKNIPVLILSRQSLLSFELIGTDIHQTLNIWWFFFPGGVYSLWACLCNPDKQLAPRFCDATPPTFKNMQSFPGRVYFFLGFVSAILMSNLLPIYMAPVCKVLKICWSFQAESTFFGADGHYVAYSKNIKFHFSRWSLLSLWDCLCSPDEWPTTKLCAAKK